MPVSCHFQGCIALLRIDKRRYIEYHAFLPFFNPGGLWGGHSADNELGSLGAASPVQILQLKLQMQYNFLKTCSS